MKFRVWILVATVTIFLPSLANAVCSSDTLFPLAADGRSFAFQYIANPSKPIAVYAPVTAGHSYSVEVTNAFEPLGGGPSASLVDFFINLPAMQDCVLADSGPLTDTTTADPALYAGGSRRVSFVAPAASQQPEYVYLVINNRDTNQHRYRVQMEDTTLYSAGWSTFGSAITYYSFANTTTQTIHGTLTLKDTSAAVVASFPVSILPGATVSTNTSALGVAPNLNGSATFAHDGPPDTVVAEADIANFSAGIVEPVKFLPRPRNH